MGLLNDTEISEALTGVPGWAQSGKEIASTFEFKDFSGSIDFVNKVAELAEAANHHPDVAISWNRVTLTLSTHSQGGLTDGDFGLARQIDGIA